MKIAYGFPFKGLLNPVVPQPWLNLNQALQPGSCLWSSRDRHCQTTQAEVLSQLKLLEVETQAGLGGLEKLWCGLDAQVHAHPEAFQESLQRLLPDLSDRSEIEVDLLSKLVLACGDVSLVQFVALVESLIEKPDCYCYLGR